MKTTANLDQILEQGDLDQLAMLLRSVSREERASSVAKSALTWYRKAAARKMVQTNNTFRWEFAISESSFIACLHAVLLTADESAISKLSYDSMSPSHLHWDLLEEFKPPTLGAWAQKLVADQRWGSLSIIHELVERGLCDPLLSDEYTVCLLSAPRANREFFENVKSDRHFLEKGVWRLFEVEGNGENSLAAHDKFTHPDLQWQTILVRLCDEGYLPRARLLDASLEALSRGFIQFRAGWFTAFHEALKPSIEERRERADAYGELLGNPVLPVVNFAIQALQLIDKTDPLSMEFLSLHLSPALTAKTKSVVLSALSLLERAQKRDRSNSLECCRLSCDALIHESPDVQAKVLKLLQQHGTESKQILSESIRRNSDLIAASLKADFEKYLGETPSVSVSAQRCMYHHQPDSEKTLLYLEQTVEPIADWNELIDCCAIALEHPEDSLQIERALEGVSRLSGAPPHDVETRTSPLLKRASKITSRISETTHIVQILFADFVQCWLQNKPAYETHLRRRRAALELNIARMSAIVDRVSRKRSLPLISLPTHHHGWIDPNVLLKRLEQWRKADEQPDIHDLVTALTRLPLETLPQTLPNLQELRGEFWDAVRHACSRSAGEKIDSPSQLWMAAEIIRSQEKYPDASTALSGIFKPPYDYDVIRWDLLLFPALRSIHLKAANRAMVTMIDVMYVHDREFRAFLETLPDPSSWADPEAIKMIAIGLILPDAQCNGYARDALIAAIQAHRLDPKELGNRVGYWLYSERSRPARLAKSLQEVARVSPLHQDAVRQLLLYALRGNGPLVPKDLYAVLELLLEILTAQALKLEDQEVRCHLETVQTGGKTKTLVKKLLAQW